MVGLRGAVRELLDMSKDIGLDGVLEVIGKLVAVRTEYLNAIVVPGIVRG